MKVLFDHNVPKKLRLLLSGHQVSTAKEMQWSELENGSLLQQAQLAGFPVMIACDLNLAYQQNLSGRTLALIVLATNNLKLLERQPRLIADAVDKAKPSSFLFLKVERR